MKRSTLFACTGVLIALSACGGGSPTAPVARAGSPCRLFGTQLTVTAMDTHFDKTCLAAPANTPFSIRFDNEDSNTHNVDIMRGGTSLFTGDIVVGPKVVTYSVGALPAGTYTFRCDVHSHQMHGLFVVSG